VTKVGSSLHSTTAWNEFPEEPM